MSIYDTTVEQAEEEKAPNGCEGGKGHIWTNLGRTDSSALAGNWPRRDNSDKKDQSFEVGRYEPSWQGVNCVPMHLLIIWPCK